MNKPLTLMIFFMLAVQLTQAQVGINTMTPKPSAALDIRSIIECQDGNWGAPNINAAKLTN